MNYCFDIDDTIWVKTEFTTDYDAIVTSIAIAEVEAVQELVV